MELNLYASPRVFSEALAKSAHVVVIDVLRASSTIVESCENGVERIIPVAEVEDATKLFSTLERAKTLLGGEQEGHRIGGFDLGNSPLEYTKRVVGGKTLIFCTTNGTVAITKSAAAPDISIGCFLNLSAVVSRLIETSPKRVAILCSGRSGVLSLEDFVCGGHMVARLHAALGAGVSMNDGAHAARSLAGCMPDPETVIRSSMHGRRLAELGFEQDLEFCARIDRYTSVPVVVDGRISIHNPTAR